MTVEDIAAYWQQDVTVDFQRPYRVSRIERRLSELPAVVSIEGWIVKPAFRLYADGTSSNEEITFFAPPANSHFIRPTLLAGRWLRPDDEAALVINIDFFQKEGDLHVGDRLTLKIEGQETDWQVVGVTTTQLVGFGEPRPEIPMAYAGYDYVSQLVGEVGQANRLVVEGAAHHAPAQAGLRDMLETHFDRTGERVRSIETHAKTRAQVENLSNPIIWLLVAMAFLFASVGGLSLMGTMSLNVLERTQEIGIMRAVGATSHIVRQVIIVEGVFVGLVSWLLATLLAYPMGKVMSIAVGLSFIKVPLTYDFAPSGILYWLIIVIVLSIIASYLPARNASRLKVRAVLAYE